MSLAIFLTRTLLSAFAAVGLVDHGVPRVAAIVLVLAMSWVTQQRGDR